MTIKNIRLDTELAKESLDGAILDEARRARNMVEEKSGKGADFLGWLDLPARIDDAALGELEASGEKLRKGDALVVVGIGGSYLGARAALEALGNPLKNDFPVIFAGHHLDAGYHSRLLAHLSDKRYSVNVISKSGTTTEPGLAFRLLWNDLEKRYGAAARKELVIATTDARKGSLRSLSDREGLKSFVIPDDVGGRYSVLTPVGLLPMAAAGLDIRSMVRGAKDMMEQLRGGSGSDPANNPALAYAAYRNGLYRKGKKIEIMAAYQPSLHYLSEWWKQLFGESEGKENRGIFPASVDLTTDLHSMGQWIQEGERSIFETVLDVKEGPGLMVPSDEKDEDGLNYLAGRDLHEINRIALRATMEAHHSGGVPAGRFEIPKMDEYHLGALFYMFEYACGISAYMLGVNPFDQPGVEAYKKNMFRMLGKPGH